MKPSKKRRSFACSLVCLILVPALLVFGFSRLSLSDGEPSEVWEKEENMPWVILDAGHGGRDPGAISLTGSMEKDLNLAVVLALKQRLEMAGIGVILTRQGDDLLDDAVEGSKKMKDLAGRVRVMQEHPDALFVSIHMNRYPSPSCQGTQVFYAEGIPGSKEMANAIDACVKRSLQPGNHRQCKAGGESIYLLDRALCRAVLVECGFLSSPEDAKLLDDPDYRDRLAGAIAAGILQTLSDSG